MSSSGNYSSKVSDSRTQSGERAVILGLSEKTKKAYDFVVGIDFGTTFSAVAYSRVGDLDGFGPVITEITKWPKGTGIITTQAPTKSVYKNGKLIKWGHQKPSRSDISEGVDSISMFKLLLNENTKRDIHIPPLPNGVTVVKAISDYLRAIFNRTLISMSDTLGSEVDRSKLRFCLTVPAVWTEKAKITMREAAIQAGIVSSQDPQDRLLLVGEPEAAALYCETVIKQYDLGHGNTFLICDAGGGTVDLVVYRINDTKDDGKFLIEVVAGDGGLCGSVNLDDGFRNLVEKSVKELTGLPLTDNDLENIVKIFAENLKFNIYAEDDPDYDDDLIMIALPYRYAGINICGDSVSIDCGQLLISPDKIVEEVFNPVVNQVLGLVKSQYDKVDNKLDAIFLVGGFGQSDYLFSKIKAEFYPEVRRVCKPQRGEVAIVRGAVLMGLNPRFVKQRVVRRTYGYECALEFEKKIDPDSLGSTDRDGKYYCNKRFVQYALKGEIRDIDYYAETSFMSYYRNNPSIHLFAYDGDINNIPRYTIDNSVQEIIRFEIQLPYILGKQPNDLVKLNVKFYLYQTEIKLQVEIENDTRIYTGSYPKEGRCISDDLTDAVDKLKISTKSTFGTQNIESSYAENYGQETEIEDDEIGIQGSIPDL